MLVLVERWKCEEEAEGGVEEERTAFPLVSAVKRVRGGARPGWMNQWQIPGRTSSLVFIHQLQRELRVSALGPWASSPLMSMILAGLRAGTGMAVELKICIFSLTAAFTHNFSHSQITHFFLAT